LTKLNSGSDTVINFWNRLSIYDVIVGIHVGLAVIVAGLFLFGYMPGKVC
jgi:hypothetical protein